MLISWMLANIQYVFIWLQLKKLALVNTTIPAEMSSGTFQSLKQLKVLKTNLDMDVFSKLLRLNNLSKLELDINFVRMNPEIFIELAKMTHWKRVYFKNGPCTGKLRKMVSKILNSSCCK